MLVKPEVSVAGSLRDPRLDDHVLVRVDRVPDLDWRRTDVGDPHDPDVAVRLILAGFLHGIARTRPGASEKGPKDPCGRAETVGGVAQTVHRGLAKVRAQFTMTMAGCQLARASSLLAALKTRPPRPDARPMAATANPVETPRQEKPPYSRTPSTSC